LLNLKIDNFLHYCQGSNFSDKSIESLSTRLNEFKKYISSTSIESLQEISHNHLLEFVTDFGNSSVEAAGAFTDEIRGEIGLVQEFIDPLMNSYCIGGYNCAQAELS